MKHPYVLFVLFVVSVSGCIGGGSADTQPAEATQEEVEPVETLSMYLNEMYNDPDLDTAYVMLSSDVQSANNRTCWTQEMNRKYIRSVRQSWIFDVNEITNQSISSDDQTATVDVTIRSGLQDPTTGRLVESERVTLNIEFSKEEGEWKIDENFDPYIFPGYGEEDASSGKVVC